MAQTQAIPFLSEEGTIVPVSSELLQYTTFLDMLYRRKEGKTPIKTGIHEHDLVLTKAICEIGLYPCTHQTHLHPKGFDDYQSLIDYMGIDDVEEDAENDYINDFLVFFGLEEEYVEEAIDPYEGWTPEMIAEQQEDDAIEELRMLAELNEPDDEPWYY